LTQPVPKPSISDVGCSASMVATRCATIAVRETMQLHASLGGTERQREMYLAKDIGKERI